MTEPAAPASSRVGPPEFPDVAGLTVGVLGGTGDLGRGLARRLALAGQRVVLGSRDASRAAAAAQSRGGDGHGTDNASCARAGDLAVVAVPYDGHRALLTGLRDALAGKIVVDCVNPLGFDKQGAYPLPVEEGSACQQAQAVVPEARVVGAFHHLSAVLLLDETVRTLDGDVLVLGDDRDATDTVQSLAARLPNLRGIYAGRLRNAHQVEAITANLIAVNRRYKAHAGLRVTDI